MEGSRSGKNPSPFFIKKKKKIAYLFWIIVENNIKIGDF